MEVACIAIGGSRKMQNMTVDISLVTIVFITDYSDGGSNILLCPSEGKARKISGVRG